MKKTDYWTYMFCCRSSGVPEPPGYERDLPINHFLRGARHLPADGTSLRRHLSVAVAITTYWQSVHIYIDHFTNCALMSGYMFKHRFSTMRATIRTNKINMLVVNALNSFVSAYIVITIARAQPVIPSAAGARDRRHPTWAKLKLKLFTPPEVT